MIATSEIPLSPPLTLVEPVTVPCGLELIDWCRRMVGLLELPCVCLERETLSIVAPLNPGEIPAIPPAVATRASLIDSLEFHSVADDVLFFVAPVPIDTRCLFGGYVRTTPRTISTGRDAAAEPQLTAPCELEWQDRLPICERPMLARLLKVALYADGERRKESSLQSDIQTLTQRIEYTHNQIRLLHTLTTHLHLSRPTEELALLCLEKLQSLIDCAGSAIVLHDSGRPLRYLPRGLVPFDQAGLGQLLTRFPQHEWTHPLVRNKLQHSLLGADFPGLKNLLIARIGEDSQRYGWIVTCNLRHARDFTNVEAALLGSIATILGTHVRNVQLFDEHDELLPSFIRSLVSTLDAKDRYTRGHSERVALIARAIGKQLHLPESDLDDIYLSSLLHDLGKIGVDDRILSKQGRLTIEEFAQIQQHPLIGYQILSPLKQLKAILPGVRNHHEAFNGKGYPDRLRGEDIPLMARIIAVADSYDAMASDRPYRSGTPLPKLEDIFRRGSGNQWDPRVIDAYFAVRDEVRDLCASYSPSVGNLLDSLSVSQSGIFLSRSATRPS